MKHLLIDAITIYPAGDTVIQAGDSIIYSAEAFDQYGNVLGSIQFEYSLVECTNCVGLFTGSVLNVTRSGQSRVQVTAEGVTALGGIVKVTPGDLSRMELQVDTIQFVGNVINSDAAIILYDEYNNLKTDYDLLANPINLYISSGELSTTELNDNSTQIGGVIRLPSYEITYTGLSDIVEIYAETGSVVSNTEIVGFNNYDIIDLVGTDGETLTEVMAGENTKTKLLILNNGNYSDNTNISYLSFYKSDPDNNVFEFDDSSSVLHETDTIKIFIPINPTPGIIDILVVVIVSDFTFNDVVYTVSDTISLPINILGSADISFSDGSFKPDSIFAHDEFDFDFDIQVDGTVPEIDSAIADLNLLSQDGLSELSNIFYGNVDNHFIQNDLISYTNLIGRINILDDMPNGYYPVEFSYQLFSGNSILTVEESIVDSIFVFFDHGLSLVIGSLKPQVVYAGSNVSFEFKVNLDSEVPYAFHEAHSVFRIYDYNYSTSTNLFLDTDSLYPGENILRSASISIQQEQLGRELLAEAKFKTCISGMTDTLEFSTSFTDASLPIEVHQQPSVQIIDLEIISPNSPKVNTSQELSMVCTIANLSNEQIQSLDIQLVSVENSSTIHNQNQTINDIVPFDTVEIYFNITASDVENLLPESFRVDILSDGIDVIPPVNNSAFLFIENPALLDLSYRVNGVENVDEFIVSHGESINLSIVLNNIGSSKISGGEYQLIIDGLLSSIDTLQGFIDDDSLLDFNFSAPLIDATVEFTFELKTVPIDINTGLEAELLNDLFTFKVFSISDETELTIGAEVTSSSLVLPGVPKSFFDFSFRNAGSSFLNDIMLNKIEFSVFNKNFNEIDARSVFNIGNSGFFEDDNKITHTTTGGNKITFWFDDFLISSGDNKSISLVLEFKNSDIKTVNFESFINQVDAVFESGPNYGLPVDIATVNGQDEILSIKFVIKGESLGESFIIRDNPFNPLESPALFSYELKKESDVEFRVFTLSGEEVYSLDIPSGSYGAKSGENMIEWDGKNNSGYLVLNGVYIASILDKSTGEYSRMKIALVK